MGPGVVFGAPRADRAKQTGASARSTFRRVERFNRLGMQSLLEAGSDEDERARPTMPETVPLCVTGALARAGLSGWGGSYVSLVTIS